jgi:anti-anti-sigma regulatory factor
VTDPGFEVNVRRAAGSIILDLLGPLGQEGGDAVRRIVTDMGQVPAHLVLNFSGAAPISTAGLGGVLFTVRLVIKAGGRTSAYGLTDHHRKVFHVMGLTQYIRVCLTEADALGSEGAR